MYKTAEYGLFLSYVTLPSFGKEKDFLKYEVENLFDCYKQSVIDNLTSTKEASDEATQIFNDYMYKPGAYCLFGNFDLAIFSLVDDFGFAIRTFHPFNSIIQERLLKDRVEGKTDYEGQNYSYHVISGVIPDLRYIDSAEHSILDKAQATFLADINQKLPFIGITSFKINNAFLLGGGGDLIDLILKKLKEVLSKTDEVEGNLEFLILHSFSWHEITIVCFSNNYAKITRKVLEVRNLVLEDLLSVDRKICKKVYFDSLITDFLADKYKLSNFEKHKRMHLFVHSDTVFGYALEFITHEKEYKPIVPSFDGQSLFTRFSIKPGHLDAFLVGLKKGITDSMAASIGKSTITSGRSDLGLEIKNDLIVNFRTLKQHIKANNLHHHLTNVSTVLEFDPEVKGVEAPKFDLSEYYFFHDHLSKFSFSLDEISEIGADLRVLRVSKIVCEKIINMFIVFNDGIHDPILFGYYLELKPFLIEVKAIIKKLTSRLDEPVADFIWQLDEIAKLFEYGYKNRFSQSHLMSEITDFNIEFNGGIQQLLSAYDGAYKCLTSFFGEKGTGKSIAYASGNTNTVSTTLGFELNYFHLYQPEFFATAVTHEAANFYLSRDSNQEEDDHFSQLKKELAKLQGEEVPYYEQTTIEYFLQDYVSLSFTFNNDFELFFYWHWCSFFQNATFYHRDGSIHQEFFDRFIYRMFLLANYIGDVACFENNIAPPFNMHDETVYKAWEVATSIARQDIPLYIEKYEELLYTIIDMVDGLSLVDLFGISKDEEVKSWVERIKKYDLKGFADITTLYLATDPEKTQFRDRHLEFAKVAREHYMNKISQEIINSFEKGELYDFRPALSQPFMRNAAQTPFQYHALFFAYLKLLYELNNGVGDKLKRNRDTGKVDKSMNPIDLFSDFGEPNLKIDPFGGFFTTDLEVRRKYYRLRVLFLKSLWCLSLKQKVKLIHPSESTL